MPSVLTLFSIPKAASPHIAVIQANAVSSWRRLGAGIVLYGDEDGVADLAAATGATHVPEVARNELGTPLLDGIFSDVHRRSDAPVLCFANSDIVLPSEFRVAIERISARKHPFLMIGESWDTDVETPINFDEEWEQELMARRGRRRGAGAIDYFAFTHGLLRDVPPFAVGRVAFDNWLVWRARSLGALVVDASPTVHALHQRHDYAHIAGGFTATRYSSSEGQRNLELAGGKAFLYTRFDATHLLRRRGLRPNLGRTFRAKERSRKAAYRLRRALSRRSLAAGKAS
jgi:hypothetical protein